MMPVPTVGSIGDIIALVSLAREVVEALNDSRGSASEYQEMMRELQILDRTLLEVNTLSQSCDNTVELNALHVTARRAADSCRKSLTEFLGKIEKYGVSLREAGSGNCLRDIKLKVEWRLHAKEDAAKIRSEIYGHSTAISMLLMMVSM